MKSIVEKAYAKLNITLDVTEPRPDGYHNMIMVMQTVSLCDDVTVTLNDSGSIKAGTNFRFIPGDERNLAVKAALRFLRETGNEKQGMNIRLEKRIPVGAGMGGGSADAAAVLRALDRLYNYPLSGEELEHISADVGSDVPFCVRGGTALATGRGEKLESLAAMPACKYIICKPDFSISTPELFKKLDKISLRCHPDTAGVIEALNSGSLAQVCRRMYNVFEDVDDRRLRTAADIKSVLLDAGALGAIMTGTGSAVYGVFEKDAETENIMQELRKEYGFCECAENIGRMN